MTTGWIGSKRPKGGLANEGCCSCWQESDKTFEIKVVFAHSTTGYEIPFDCLQAAVTALEALLVKNSTALPTKPSQMLKNILEDLKRAIFLQETSVNSESRSL